MSIHGIMVFGAATLLSDGEETGAISSDPVWLAADTIDAAILSGDLQAGAFNSVDVHPPASEWPERWQHLKE